MLKDPKFYAAVFVVSLLTGILSRKVLVKIPRIGSLFA